MTHKIVVVDDHTLLGQAIGHMVNSFDNFETLYECQNGEELLTQLQTSKEHPDIILMDINMPIMDGIEATEKVSSLWPEIKIMALSVEEEDSTILSMLKAGACGYLLKDSKKSVLRQALEQLVDTGYYHTPNVAKLLVNSLKEPRILDTLKDREREFLTHACTDRTYKEIANIMCVSPKTVEGYRDSLYEKLEIRNRIGLVLFAIKNKLVNP